MARAPSMMRLASRFHVLCYRLSGGRIGANLRGLPMLLLTTRGRKTGALHTTPLTYLQDGDRFVIIGSKGGSDTHPLWYLNLRANPDVTVQVGRRSEARRARTATDAERTVLWPRVVALYPGYARYQAATKRTIPLVILERGP